MAYDSVSNRFIIVASGFHESPTVQKLYIAVSQNSEATGNYWIYAINTNLPPVGVPGDFWDYPIIGMDHDSVFITGNIADAAVPDTRLISLPQTSFVLFLRVTLLYLFQ